MQNKTIKIEGMKCEGCAKTVKESLEKVEGIKSVEVNLAEKTVTLATDKDVADGSLKQAVETGTNFKVVEIK